MAEKIVSPGVFTRENDLSFLQQGIADIGTAFIGPFKEGPLVPTLVNTQTEFEQLFGTVDDAYYTPIAVQAYLKEAGAATICRVAGVGGYTEPTPLILTLASGSTTASVGILFNTSTTTTGSLTGSTITNIGNGDFIFTGTSNRFTTSLDPADVNDIESSFGADARGTKEGYVYAFFTTKAATLVGAGYTASLALLPTQDFTNDAQEAKTPYIQSQLISGQRYNLLRFETIGAGNAANTKVKVGITNIKAAGTISGTDYGTFTIVVRAYSDTNRRKTVYETYSNVTLDPNSVNYVYRVIGDRHITIGSDGKVTETGDWVNKSKYVRLVNSERDSSISYEKIPVQAIPAGHAAYKLPVSGSTSAQSNLIPAATYVEATATVYGGINLDGNTDNTIYIKPLPIGAPTGSNTAFSLDTNNGGGTAVNLTSTSADEIVKRNFIVAFQEGWDGTNPTTQIKKAGDITNNNTQGFDCTSLTTSGSIAYLKQINALSNADEYDVQMVVTPGLDYQNHTALVNAVLDMVTDRGDAFYIMEGVGYSGTINEVRNQAAEVDSNYAGMYYPWVKTIDVNTNRLIAIPPSTLLPAVYAANDRVAAEWFAPAGLNRGGLSGAVAVLNKLTQTDRDNLYESKVNPIVQFPGQGIVAFGQKTLQDKPSALDRINVRRLLLTVRKYVASTSRYLIFEQNTSTTRNRFLNIVNPYFEGIQQRQGLYAFKVVMDESNNTPDSIDRNFLNGSIYLQPTKTAEFIQIDFNILPTGATFGG